jgi:SNF2 family DNA or RNA helicase
MDVQIVRPLIHRARQTVLMPDEPGYRTAFPHARTLQVNGQPTVLAVKHTIDVARVLANIGVEAPSPIDLYYDWSNGTPFDAQRVTARLMVSNDRAYVLNAFGTGKTRASLYACDYLIRCGRIKRALVVAPLSTLSVVWEREAVMHFPALRPVVLHGSRDKRVERIQGQDWNLGIINHDGVYTVLSYLLLAGIQAVVLDELAAFRNRKSRKWKNAKAVVERVPFAWGLTGAPTPNSLTDAWAQVRLLTPERAPPTMGEFRDMVETRVTQWKWLPKPGGKNVVAEMMQPAVRFTREEVAELPPLSVVERQVTLEPVQVKAYKALQAKAHAKFMAGEVTAVNSGVLINKLLQVAAGCVYSDTRGVIRLPCAPRLAEVEDLIEQADAKVIVYVAYRHLTEMVEAHLRKRWPVAVVHGDVATGVRNRIFNAFQDEPEPHVLVAHPQCMAHGLTLTAADTIVWYGPLPNLEIYEQANARITRPGQTRHQVIAHIQASRVEREVYRMLRDKADIQQGVLDLFAEMGKGIV